MTDIASDGYPSDANKNNEFLKSPPLFAWLWSDGGDEMRLMADRHAVLGLDVRQQWTCRVMAPGGKEAGGLLDLVPGDAPVDIYSQLSAFFQEQDLVRLWFAPMELGERARASTDVLSDLSLGIWDSQSTRLSPDVFDFQVETEHPYWLVPKVSTSGAFYLETPDPSGVSAFVVMRETDLLLYDVAVRQDRLSLTPRVHSQPGYHTVYWGFLRQGRFDAAREAARCLVSELERREQKSDVGSDSEAVLAAAHAIVRFREFWSAEALVELHLGLQKQSIDVRIMRWVLSFEKEGISDGEGGAFITLLESFRSEKPIYAETFRLFVERLAPAARFAKDIGSDSGKLQDAVSFVEVLAASSYWNGEHLVYRGRSPAEPAPAVEDQGVSAQKKTMPVPSARRFYDSA